MKKSNKVLILILAVFLILISILTACYIPQAAIASASPSDIAGILVTPNPNATHTPTPFQPLANTPTPPFTPTPLASPTPTETATITPTATSEGPVPQASTLAPPEGTVNILILGSDWRPAAGFRTDVIMLAMINPSKGTVSVISFPRDLWVYLPGVGMQRINTAQAFGGFQLTQATFEYNFGVRPDYYVMTNFQGFQQIIDSLGGISVQASINLTDRCDLPMGNDGWCSVGPGTYQMDGQTALWYARSRKSTSDFDRTRRAQEVMQGVFTKLMNLNAIGRIPELYQLYKNNVETNIGLDTIISMAPMAPKLLSDSSRIHRYAIGPQDVTSWVTEGGAQVLLPNQWAVWEKLRQALNAE
ncbi:MAG TPA: LCP family protein [Anaerolineaceae bacterium]|nr:LCP family protein [Anaerolineaceae bacterium]